MSDQVELFTKAAKDGMSPAGCPLCQRLNMILLMKASLGNLKLTVTPINMAKPPPDFKKITSRLPAIIHNDETLTDPDEIVQYIDHHFHYPPMAYDNIQAAEACRDVFSKFSFFIKDVATSPTALVAELQKLNDYLASSPHKYLCRDGPDHLDCIMLPKLQHIRVASRDLKGFEIPHEMTALWRYMDMAYHTDVFTQTCPSDQEIVCHWVEKPQCPQYSKEKKIQVALSDKASYSLSIPPGVSI
jgi:chloride intracellular channel protein 2